MAASAPPLTFKAGAPSIVALTCKRNCAAEAAPEGRVSTTVETALELDDSQKTLTVAVTVGLEGVADADNSVAFSVNCQIECTYVFNEPRPEKDLENRRFTKAFCDPLYQRAAVLVQDLAWKMGYNAIRVPLMFPTDKDVVKEGAEGNTKAAPAKSRRSPARTKPKAS